MSHCNGKWVVQRFRERKWWYVAAGKQLTKVADKACMFDREQAELFLTVLQGLHPEWVLKMIQL